MLLQGVHIEVTPHFPDTGAVGASAEGTYAFPMQFFYFDTTRKTVTAKQNKAPSSTCNTHPMSNEKATVVKQNVKPTLFPQGSSKSF